MKLLNVDKNAKTVKGQKRGYLTGILYLAPASVSGYEVCPMRSPGCTQACLNTAGLGRLQSVAQSRINKTQMFFKEREKFMLLLEKEIVSLIKKAEKNNLVPVVRLNGTSDIVWESVPFKGKDGKRYKNMMERFPDIQFYDYTKRHIRRKVKNYHLTFSMSETNEEKAKKALQKGMNVAVVFNKKPRRYLKTIVVDGDKDDLRFLDKENRIVGLTAKGKAKKDTTGFVKN